MVAARAIADGQPRRRGDVAPRRVPFFLTVNRSRSKARHTEERPKAAAESKKEAAHEKNIVDTVSNLMK